MKRTRTLETPIGRLYLESEDGFLTRVSFQEIAEGCAPDAVLNAAAQQLIEYFSKARTEFALPLRPEGTPFQQSVWRALQAIPYGKTASYQDIAQSIGKPNACRAVGGANHVNPLPIIIPCHRVIGANGALTGYAGGLEIKRRLLALEGLELEEHHV